MHLSPILRLIQCWTRFFTCWLLPILHPLQKALSTRSRSLPTFTGSPCPVLWLLAETWDLGSYKPRLKNLVPWAQSLWPHSEQPALLVSCHAWFRSTNLSVPQEPLSASVCWREGIQRGRGTLHTLSHKGQHFIVPISHQHFFWYWRLVFLPFFRSLSH